MSMKHKKHVSITQFTTNNFYFSDTCQFPSKMKQHVRISGLKNTLGKKEQTQGSTSMGSSKLILYQKGEKNNYKHIQKRKLH